MPKYSSTMLAQNPTALEIQKADLDLLKKINELAAILTGDAPAGEDAEDFRMARGIPVGVPVPVLAPATLSEPFFPCDGRKIADSASIYDGTRLINLNGVDVVLTLTFTPDAGGSYAICPLADIPALGLHDWVTGSGIADHTWIADIDYSTGEVILSDTAASGSIECTFSNEGRGIIGGAFGSVGDQMQQITGTIGVGGGNIGFRGSVGLDGCFSLKTPYLYGNVVSGGSGIGYDYNFDSADSPDARTSADTWGKTKTDAYKLTYYMRIK